MGVSGASNGNAINSPANGGIPQAGYQLTSFSNITLGSSPVSISNTNLRPPNGYPASNLNLLITVTDTTGTTVPSGVNSIESAIQSIAIVGKSGRPLWLAQGTFGELQRWQQLLNDNESYSVAPTPADSAASTAYPVTWNVTYKHVVLDPSEAPFSVVLLPNTLSSRATTPNSMTSVITSLTVNLDFVPTQGYVRTIYHTKQVSDSSTGYFDLGPSVDSAMISAIAADFGADSKLNASNTFYIADNGNTLLPYTSYNSIIAAQNALPATSSGASNHISGFFPVQALYKAAINGADAIKFMCNVASAPSGGGQANTINLYQAEQY